MNFSRQVSSFLRAGLIPFLETEGFFFRKEETPDRRVKAIFVRSTDAPLTALAENLFEFIETGCGRRPLTDREREVLGPLAEKFPLLG